jgi:hypothetical protein
MGCVHVCTHTVCHRLTLENYSNFVVCAGRSGTPWARAGWSVCAPGQGRDGSSCERLTCEKRKCVACVRDLSGKIPKRAVRSRPDRWAPRARTDAYRYAVPGREDDRSPCRRPRSSSSMPPGTRLARRTWSPMVACDACNLDSFARSVASHRGRRWPASFLCEVPLEQAAPYPSKCPWACGAGWQLGLVARLAGVRR